MKYLENPVEHELIIDKSRFITNIYIVNSLSEVQSILIETKKRHRDANHNCYAYILNQGNEVKASDDGEPSKTAGVPILEVLKHHELSDCLCVVTRYFGGIKLGAGGLIRAYSNSVSKALELASFVKKEQRTKLEIMLPYALYDGFIYQFKDHIDILDQSFKENITLTVILKDITILDLKEKYHQIVLNDLGEVIVSVKLK
ncbi:MAG: YigZ family protein [Acholeplasma sp.]|nr:YigZ family protein [Acholeplasma sp.]